jgi:hypothetical protein
MAGFMSTDLMELVRDMLVGDKEYHMKRFAKCVVEINEMINILKVFTYIPGYFLSIEHRINIEYDSMKPSDWFGKKPPPPQTMNNLLRLLEE